MKHEFPQVEFVMEPLSAFTVVERKGAPAATQVASREYKGEGWDELNDSDYAQAVLEQEAEEAGLYLTGGRYFATCRNCENRYHWEGPVEEFDQHASENVCGGSQYCLP